MGRGAGVRRPGRAPARHPGGRLSRSRADFLARFIALVGQSVAAPWLGIMLIFLFAVNLRWLPSSGASRPESVILPAIVAGAYSAAGLTRRCAPACSR
jgi:ABC-type dipeptide/oligopeptide/nickel transport system permease component